MAGKPLVIGLTLCEDVVTEPLRGRVSLIRSFSGSAVASFPGRHTPFRVYAPVTGVEGPVEFSIVVESSEDLQEIYRFNGRFDAADRLGIVNVTVRITGCVFPEPGRYVFYLLAGGEIIAQRSLRVYAPEEEP